LDLRVLGAVALGLGCFGWAVDGWVERLQRKGMQRGITSLLVVVGVAVTGAGYGLVVGSLSHALLLGTCFVASGVPMVVGSLRRYLRARAAEESAAKGTVKGALQGER